MMRGYWARPDLNRTAFFVREPFPGFQDLFYRTGDLVRERADGNLVFLGRKDRQIKIRGYRVELDEIESVLGAFDDVTEAAVVVLKDDSGLATIVAVVLPRGPRQISGEELRRRAADRLPPYAVPQRIEIRSALPRTATGKIDRKALAASCAS
jgi:acyl-coenzyme A synthetase/AMP-(fatty) acid ligase